LGSGHRPAPEGEQAQAGEQRHQRGQTPTADRGDRDDAATLTRIIHEPTAAAADLAASAAWRSFGLLDGLHEDACVALKSRAIRSQLRGSQEAGPSRSSGSQAGDVDAPTGRHGLLGTVIVGQEVDVPASARACVDGRPAAPHPVDVRAVESDGALVGEIDQEATFEGPRWLERSLPSWLGRSSFAEAAIPPR
jgi:hypothetical protein